MSRPLYMPLNQCVVGMTARLFPAGYDVGAEAPDTLEKLRDHVLKTGRMLVWNGASENTIFGDPEINWGFRAWHDHCHLRNREGKFDPAAPIEHLNGFTLNGERVTALEMCSDIRKVYGYGPIAKRMMALVWAEVVGQAMFFERHGRFPQDQVAFVRAYLVDPECAVEYACLSDVCEPTALVPVL